MLRLRRREEMPSSLWLRRGSESRDAFSMPATTVELFDALFCSLPGADVESTDLPCDCSPSPSTPVSGPLTRGVEACRNGGSQGQTCFFPWLLGY